MEMLAMSVGSYRTNCYLLWENDQCVLVDPGFEPELTGAVCTGEHVVADGNVITAKGAGCSLSFGHAIVSAAVSKATADKVLSDMQCF